mmetsp:Transcript_845/g.2221  ORF Transcript_845/g.2221 Transcript_845/m.2221 type:complete len:148 (+) Transcript_845:163-606(+)
MPNRLGTGSEVFMDIAIGGRSAGRIVIELNTHVCPRTSENFLALCTGSKGYGYKTSAIHRCVPKFCVHGGDFTHRDGTGGRSIYGLSFADESFELRHNGPGVVSMANKGPNSNNSQFFISLTAAPWLDGVHVAFGLVVEGFSVVKKN